jgi:hypothetical protein
VPQPTGLSTLTVRLLHVLDCPHSDVAAIRLRVALDATGHADTPVEFIMVRSDEQARELEFHGSPTVLLNGADPFAGPDTSVGLACRLYRTAHGTAGAPSVEQLVDAIQAFPGGRPR